MINDPGRPIKQLLELLKIDTVRLLYDLESSCLGMCEVVRVMYKESTINAGEYIRLMRCLSLSEPKGYAQWDSGYWYPPRRIQPRVAWIEKAIEEYKEL